jgi:hypothetical protein
MSEKAESKRRQVGPEYANEEERQGELGEDGRRPLAANLAEGLALGEFISTFPGAKHLTEREQLRAFRAQKEVAERD